MSESRPVDLAAQLERFVKEQASLYGEVISYVPATPAKGSVAPTAPADASAPTDESTMAKRTSTKSKVAKASEPEVVSVTHHGFAELQAKLEPYAGEAWTQATTLNVLQEAIEGCMKCRLGESRTKLVFGVGNQESKVLVIGEAPGADEDATGEPFVGRAGQLLNKMLAAVNFQREEVYIANILKSRPPANRDPKPDEVAACEPYLWKQILILQPKLILCMGRVAATNLLKINESLAKMRGNVFDFHGIKVMATYHPAALLRNPDWKHGAWEDLKQFRRLYNDMVAEG